VDIPRLFLDCETVHVSEERRTLKSVLRGIRGLHEGRMVAVFVGRKLQTGDHLAHPVEINDRIGLEYRNRLGL